MEFERTIHHPLLPMVSRDTISQIISGDKSGLQAIIDNNADLINIIKK